MNTSPPLSTLWHNQRGIRAQAPLGNRLKTIEREQGLQAALDAAAHAMDHPGELPDNPVGADVQCCAIFDWATTTPRGPHGDPASGITGPATLKELGSSSHPKAAFARAFTIHCLGQNDIIRHSAAEQMAHHDSLCAAWAQAAHPGQPYPAAELARAWAQLSPRWMLAEPMLCIPVVALLDAQPLLTGPIFREELAGRPWMSQAIARWMDTHGSYHAGQREAFLEGSLLNASGRSAIEAKKIIESRITSMGSDAVASRLAANLRRWTRLGSDHGFLSLEESPTWLREAMAALSGVDAGVQTKHENAAFAAETERLFMQWLLPEGAATAAPKRSLRV